MQVQYLNPMHLHTHWEVLEKFIRDALELGQSEDYTAEQIKVLLVNKQWHLFIASELNVIQGCAVISFMNYPNSCVAFICAIGGKFIGNKETFENLNHLLRKMGATKINGYARESVARLWRRLGFVNRHILVEYKL